MHLRPFERILLTLLGLTKVTPVIVFEESQIRNWEYDIRSPTGEVMNDGIGRVSPSVMRKIRDKLGLTDTPCAIQARFGSAKGMWITDVTESGQEDWIETYVSQRKWKCDWSDEYRRTLEVKAYAVPLRSANLNLQFLPILEDRAIDKTRMRNIIGNHLAVELARDLDSMKTAIKHPELFRQWTHESSTYSGIRLHNREVPFLGGLPVSEQDKMAFLVDGGFDPMQQKYLQDLVFCHQRKKCKKLETDLKIKIARSTYAFMVVDFLGVLQPDEVQLCFSSKFIDDPDNSDDYFDLDGIDVLVGRSPAHLPSDIQKVRAVFKPELRQLKDVIIFPRTGNTPLADMLSGGDYDGDKAWVCWEPEIVDNFRGVPLTRMDERPDFSQYMERDRDTVSDFSRKYDDEHYIDAMIEKAFAFSLRPKLLGICTSYKDKLSYHYNSISEEPVIALSWFLSELADQAKNGIIFNDRDWKRLRGDVVGEECRLVTPAYKEDRATPLAHADHILDHLRFVVAKGVIETELRSLNDFYKSDPAHTFDADLVDYWNQFERALGRLDRNSIPRAGWFVHMKRKLVHDLEGCRDEWRRQMMNEADFRHNVHEIYNQWGKIEPFFGKNIDDHDAAGDDDGDDDDEHRLTNAVATFLMQRDTHPPELSQWQLLKASMTFKMFYAVSTNFTWQVAGRQLQFIKAMKISTIDSNSGRGAPIPVVANLYAALRPDNKYIRRVIAWEGGGGDYRDGTREDGYDDRDDDEEWFEDAAEYFNDPDLYPDLTGLEAAVGGLSVGGGRRAGGFMS